MIHNLLHLDVYLNAVIAQYGSGTYALLFLVVFCETGLVITPFLPGDSLLFAAGAFAATGSLNLGLLTVSLLAAAIFGDALNYAVGSLLGPKVWTSHRRFLRREHLEKTHAFYEKYGGKTLVIARFVPIIRTFAPFLAGVGKMSYWRFATYNVVGGSMWVVTCVFAGYFFGNLAFVKNNFSLVVLAIILISVLPAAIETLRVRASGTPKKAMVE